MTPATASSPKLVVTAVVLGSAGLAVVGASWLSNYPLVATAIVLAVATVAVGWATTARFEQVTLLLIATRTILDVAHGEGGAGLLRPSVLVTGAYTAAAGIWLVRRHAVRPIRVSAVGVSVGLFTLASLVSAALSSDQTTAFAGAAKWVFLTVFVLVLENLIVDRRSVVRLLIAVAVSAIVPLTLGMWQFGAGLGGEGAVTRVEGTFSHPNTYGFYLVTLGLLIAATIRSLRSVQKLIAGSLLLVILISLLATYSRSSYVAFAAGLMALVIVGRRWTLLTVAMIGIGAALLFPGVPDRLADIGEATTVRGTPGDSLAWRLGYWGEVVEAGEGRRVTGLGLGVTSGSTEAGREPHNDFLRAFVETGALGLVAYLGLITCLGARIVRSLRSTGRTDGAACPSRDLAEAFMAIFVAYLIAGVVSNLMTQLILLWYVLAIGAVATVPHIKGQRVAGSRAPDLAGAPHGR